MKLTETAQGPSARSLGVEKGDGVHRAWSRLRGARDALLAGLSPSELRTVLLEVAQARAAATTAAEIVRPWDTDPWSGRPQPIHDGSLAEAELWRLLPDELRGVDLSAVTPPGTCGRYVPGSQDRIVTTTMGEPVSAGVRKS